MVLARQRSKGAVFVWQFLTGENRTIESLTRANSLFLSAAAQNNHEQLSSVHKWFSGSLSFVTQERAPLAVATAQMCKDETFKNAVLELMRNADLGIIGLEISEEPFDPELIAAIEGLLATLQSKES